MTSQQFDALKRSIKLTNLWQLKDVKQKKDVKPNCHFQVQEININANQFTSIAQSCPTLCDPMDCSTPGLPVHHQLLKLTQTHPSS